MENQMEITAERKQMKEISESMAEREKAPKISVEITFVEYDMLQRALEALRVDRLGVMEVRKARDPEADVEMIFEELDELDDLRDELSAAHLRSRGRLSALKPR